MLGFLVIVSLNWCAGVLVWMTMFHLGLLNRDDLPLKAVPGLFFSCFIWQLILLAEGVLLLKDWYKNNSDKVVLRRKA